MIWDTWGTPVSYRANQTQIPAPTPAKPLPQAQTQVTTTTPQQQVTTPAPRTQAFVPEPVRIDPSFISFWEDARRRNEQDSSYLTQRNNMLAQWFASQNVVDESAIMQQLQKMGNFAAQPLEDQQNTAQRIAEMIRQQQLQQTTQPWIEQPWQQPFTSQEMIDRATENTIEQEQQAYLQDVQRAWTLFDRNVYDLEEAKRLHDQALDRRLEEVKTGIERQVEDIQIQTRRSLEWYDKVGALKWFNRSSWFVAWLENIKQDAERTIGRLQADLQTFTDATGEARDEALKQLQTNMARAKEDFEFAMRDVMDLARIDVNSLVDKYGLSSDKLSNRLDSITLDVLQRRENLVSTYIANARNTLAIANDQLGILQWYDNMIHQERDRYTSVLNMDSWAALASMTPQSIQTAVQEWRLTPAQWEAYKQLMFGKAINTLIANGQPTQADIQQLTNMIETGVTPAAAIARIISDNPDRYSAVDIPDRRPVSWQPWLFHRTSPNWEIEFTTAPWVGEMASMWVQPQVVESVLESFINAPNRQVGEQWWQCGKFVNDYLDQLWVWRIFTDPIDAKVARKNSDTPTVWSIAIFDYTDNPNASDAQRQYGHVAIVTSINPDWTFNTRESNINGEERVFERQNLWTNEVVWFFDPSKWDTLLNEREMASPLFRQLDPAQQEVVRGLVDYRVNLPWRATTDYVKLVGAASQLDPTFSSAKYDERKKFKEQWNTTTIRWWSLSKAATTMQLIAQLEDIYQSLRWQSRVQALNDFVNFANRQIGNPNITSFDVARDLVVREMAGAFKGTASPTEQDVADMSKILSDKLTPAQTQSALNLAADGMFKRINSEALSYINIMDKQPDSIFDPETYQRMQSKWLPVEAYFAPPQDLWERFGGQARPSAQELYNQLMWL
jgi:hypothetical protein